jgi:hypothetical protein
MTWVWLGLAAWVLLAVVCALVLGRSIRVADRKRRESANFVVDELRAPTPREPLAFEADSAFGVPAGEPQRRTGPHSVVQNCVPASERAVPAAPRLPHPGS